VEVPVNKPSVLIITADTTRQDDLSCFGGAAPTPALEALSRDGTRFEEAHSVAFGTTPSHSSLMTSMHASRHGVYNNKSMLGEEHETLAEYLSSHGYDTAAFVSARPLARSLGLAQGFDRYEDVFPMDPDSGLGQYAVHERRAERTVDLFLAWLDEREVPAGAPFFAWIHFFDAHQPYAPPAGSYTPDPERMGQGFDPEAYLVGDEGQPLYLHAHVLAKEAPERLAHIGHVARARYRAEIAYLDSQIARLRDILIERDLYDSMLVIFLADHGENFLERDPWLAFGHAGLHSEVTRVPLIVKWPGGIEASARSGDLVASIDIAPTVAEVLGIPPQAAWQGRSLLGGGPAREHLILEGMEQQEIAIRTPRWLYREISEKIVHRERTVRSIGFKGHQRYQLFDLANDPEERLDVYGEAHPALPDLRAEVAVFGGARPGQAEELTDPEHIEALRALGYVE